MTATVIRLQNFGCAQPQRSSREDFDYLEVLPGRYLGNKQLRDSPVPMTACEERTKLKQETAVQTKRGAVTQRDGSVPAEEEQRGTECSGGEDKNEKVRTKNSAVATNEDKYVFCIFSCEHTYVHNISLY